MKGSHARRLAPIVALACVATAAPAYAYIATTVTGEAVLRTATLGKPGAAAESEGSHLSIRLIPPGDGPAPTRYSVVRTAADGSSGDAVVCDRTAELRCPDLSAPPAAELSYVVRAHLGDHWIADSETLRVVSPPPQPLLAQVAGSSTVTVSAPAGRKAYRIDVFVDDAGDPYRTLTTEPGERLNAEIDSTSLTPGPHTVRAVSSLEGMQSTSEPLELVTVVPASQPSDPGTSPASSSAPATSEPTTSEPTTSEPTTSGPTASPSTTVASPDTGATETTSGPTTIPAGPDTTTSVEATAPPAIGS